MSDAVPGAPQPYAPAPDGQVVLYRGAVLVDGTGGPARPATTVVTAGERIVRVAPDEEVRAGDHPGAHRVDLAGRHLLPGLIDAHQHIATPPDRPLAEKVLRRDLLGGVTATRDMADDLRQVADLARAARVGEIAAPDIHFAALMAGPGFFDDPRTWQVCQGATPGAVPWMQAITPDTDLRLAVALARGTGAAAIKVYADLPGETVAAITAEAHRQGIPVWAHAAVFPATPGEVVTAGVDTVSHVTLLVHEAAGRPLTSYRDKPPVDRDRFLGGDDPAVAALLERMRDRGTLLDATASMWGRIARDPGTGPELLARAQGETALAVALTAQAHRAGVEICTGTDADPDAAEPLPPLHEELDFLHRRCGIPAEQVVRAATLAGARAIRAEADMGTVEEGKLANLLVLDEDPLADMAHLRSVTFTVKRGRRHDQEQP